MIVPSNISQERGMPWNLSEVQPPASPAGKHQCSSSWLHTLKEFKKKKSAEYPGAQSESESGKEDVNGVDMQILKGKHFFFF